MARVTNIVATANLNCLLDLSAIEAQVPMALYIPQKFSGLLVRIFTPFKAHCQLYRNGKITVNGGKSEEDSKALLDHFVAVLKVLNYGCTVSDYKIVNVVGSCDFGRVLDLGAIAKMFDVWYEPELFPGLRVKLSTCSAVIFHTGKCNFLGGKDETDIHVGHFELSIFIQ
jgi:transcription initiation factor TFIID TATA-box-binding protein